MDKYSLIEPSPSMEQAHLHYLAQWKKSGETVIPKISALGEMSYAKWLAYLEDIKQNPPPGFVPSTLYAFINNKQDIFGYLDLRHCLNDILFQFGGHIGYALSPFVRGQKLAPIMLALGLQKARERELFKILITCDKNNIASAKTILHCGGILQNEVLEEDIVKQRYWITLA